MQTDEPDNGNIPEDGYGEHEPDTEHRTEEKAAGILHGALEKIISIVKGYLKHNENTAEPDFDYDESEPEEQDETTEDMEEDEEYTKATYYMLTKEERCHL